MATYYAAQQVGVADGTKVPADKADGRQIGAKMSTLIAAKVAAQAWASGDKIYVGKLRPGETLIGFFGTTDTTFGTATVSLGTLADATKYANVKTLTATDVPVALGPKAAARALGPVTADEDLYLTIGTAGVAGAVVATFDLDIASVK